MLHLSFSVDFKWRFLSPYDLCVGGLLKLEFIYIVSGYARKIYITFIAEIFIDISVVD